MSNAICSVVVGCEKQIRLHLDLRVVVDLAKSRAVSPGKVLNVQI